MSSPSNPAPPSSSSSGSAKRLLNELKNLHSSPLPSFLSSLGPVSDAQMLVWEAIMLGPGGGAYHGIFLPHNIIFILRDFGEMRGALTWESERESDVIGGRWKLDISIPDTYPLHPPKIKFRTPICHPNIHFKVKISLFHPFLPSPKPLPIFFFIFLVFFIGNNLTSTKQNWYFLLNTLPKKN